MAYRSRRVLRPRLSQQREGDHRIETRDDEQRKGEERDESEDGAELEVRNGLPSGQVDAAMEHARSGFVAGAWLKFGANQIGHR